MHKKCLIKSLYDHPFKVLVYTSNVRRTVEHIQPPQKAPSRNVPKRKGMLPPVLDMEWNPFSPTCAHIRPEGAEVRRQMKVFMDILEQHYGQRPIIYTTPGFYKDAGLKRMKGEEFWLRSTAKTPDRAFPGQGWSFWQYSATGVVPGIGVDVDLNVFKGGRDAWTAWLKARAR